MEEKVRHKGLMCQALDGSQVFYPYCKCGWEGTPTSDRHAANRESLAHSDAEWLEEIKDLIPYLDGTLPDTYPEEEWIPNKYAPGSTVEE